MAVNFPESPTEGQQYQADNGITYVYTDSRWVSASSSGSISAITGPQGEQGATGPQGPAIDISSLPSLP